MDNPNNLIIPTVVEREGKIERTYDIISRIMKDRVILFIGEVNDQSVAIVVAQLLYLDAEKVADIQLYINSPGGSISAGMFLYDTMQTIKSDVVTVGAGLNASMGAFLLCTGTPGKRMILPNTEVLIHQPLGGTGPGSIQSTDIQITAKHIDKLRNKLETIMSERSNLSFDDMHIACERDNWMSAKEAQTMGLVDEIISAV